MFDNLLSEEDEALDNRKIVLTKNTENNMDGKCGQ